MNADIEPPLQTEFEQVYWFKTTETVSSYSANFATSAAACNISNADPCLMSIFSPSEANMTGLQKLNGILSGGFRGGFVVAGAAPLQSEMFSWENN